MALVVESTANNSASNTDTVVVTKPTGVEAGDLLLIAASGGTNAVSPAYPTCTGFTRIQEKAEDGGSNDPIVGLLYRIADASDESATDYTVTTQSNAGAAAIMLRVSGWSTINPLYSGSTDAYASDGDVTVAITGLTLTRPAAQLALIYGVSTGAENYVDFGTYQITSADSNPSWTEVAELDFQGGSGTLFKTLFLAYANTSDTSTITGYGFQHTAVTTGGSEYVAHCLAVIVEPTNDIGTNTLLSVSPTIFTNAGVDVGTIGTNALLENSNTFFDQSGKGTTSTQWSNPNKPATTWTNTPK